MMKRKKNINQADLFDLVEQLNQLEQVRSELNMIESHVSLELNTIIEKQIDWVEL